MLSAKVDSKDLEKALAKAPAKTRGFIMQGINAAGIVLQRGMIEEAPKHDGILKNSIEVRTGQLKVEVGPSTKAPYAVFVEKGTKPHWVAIRHIEKWAIDHGIPPFAVQRSIAAKGTKANPFVRRTYDKHAKAASKKGSDIIEKRIKDIL